MLFISPDLTIDSVFARRLYLTSTKHDPEYQRLAYFSFDFLTKKSKFEGWARTIYPYILHHSENYFFIPEPILIFPQLFEPKRKLTFILPYQRFYSRGWVKEKGKIYSMIYGHKNIIYFIEQKAENSCKVTRFLLSTNQNPLLRREFNDIFFDAVYGEFDNFLFCCSHDLCTVIDRKNMNLFCTTPRIEATSPILPLIFDNLLHGYIYLKGEPKEVKLILVIGKKKFVMRLRRDENDKPVYSFILRVRDEKSLVLSFGYSFSSNLEKYLPVFFRHFPSCRYMTCGLKREEKMVPVIDVNLSRKVECKKWGWNWEEEDKKSLIEYEPKRGAMKIQTLALEAREEKLEKELMKNVVEINGEME